MRWIKDIGASFVQIDADSNEEFRSTERFPT